MVKYSDLIRIKTKENSEKLVKLDANTIPNGYAPEFSDMKIITGENIFVRETIAEKLNDAQTDIKKKYSNLSLFVTFGFRDLSVQTIRFLKELKNQNIFYADPSDLYEAVHRYIAVPNVAGHPTGGAIDIIIVDKDSQKTIDFGGKQYDYRTKNCYVFTNAITQKQKENRMLLRTSLINVGFAPFDGEWWHFSYGDREWAYFYKKENAIYNQIAYEDLSKFMV